MSCRRGKKPRRPCQMARISSHLISRARARKTGVAQAPRLHLVWPHKRQGSGRVWNWGKPCFPSRDISHFTPVPLIRLSSRHFDITLKITVDYSRNERGVLGRGWAAAAAREAHAMPPRRGLASSRAAPFEVSGKVGSSLGWPFFVLHIHKCQTNTKANNVFAQYVRRISNPFKLFPSFQSLL